MTDNNTFYKTLNDLPLGGGKLAAEVDGFFAEAKEYINRREIDHVSCDASIRAAEFDIAEQLPERITLTQWGCWILVSYGFYPGDDPEKSPHNFPSIAASHLTHSVIGAVYHTLQLLGIYIDNTDEEIRKKLDPIRRQGEDVIKSVQRLLEEIVTKCGGLEPASTQSCSHSQDDDCSCPWRPRRTDEPAMRQFLGDCGPAESHMQALDAIYNFEAQSREFVEAVLKRLNDAKDLPSRKNLPGVAKLDVKAVTKAINDLKKMLSGIYIEGT